METTALNPRQSLMNRTIIISKKSVRRPKLPEATLHVPNNDDETIDQNVEKELHFKNVNSMGNGTDFVELERILHDNLVSNEIAEQILELANLKAKQWNELIENYEKDKLMERQLFELKLNAANQNNKKAMELFNMLAENGIDIDAMPIGHSADSIRRHLLHRTSPLCTEGTTTRTNSPNECKLVRENHALNGEINSLEENYSNLFKLYEKTKLNCANLKEVEQSLTAQLEQLERKYNALHKMYMELLVEAQKKLNEYDHLHIKFKIKNARTMN